MRVKILIQFILENIWVRVILDSALSYDEHVTKLILAGMSKLCQLRWNSGQTTRKISRLTFYCDTQSVLVLKVFAKIAKYRLLTQHKLWRHKLVKNVYEYKTELL